MEPVAVPVNKVSPRSNLFGKQNLPPNSFRWYFCFYDPTDNRGCCIIGLGALQYGVGLKENYLDLARFPLGVLK